MRSHPANRTPPRLLRRFRRDRSGAVAIEFTMLAIPFCLLVFAILETCISFAAQQVMANAVDDVARQLRTGFLREADASVDGLKTRICSKLSIITTNCAANIIVELSTFKTFAEAASKRITIVDKKVNMEDDAKLGGSMSKNMLRVVYKWPVMTDLLRSSMANIDDDKTMLFASVTWQNEPFDD